MTTLTFSAPLLIRVTFKKFICSLFYLGKSGNFILYMFFRLRTLVIQLSVSFIVLFHLDTFCFSLIYSSFTFFCFVLNYNTTIPKEKKVYI